MRLLLCVVVMTLSCGLMAQTKLSLENLDDFQPQAGNWQIIGDIVVDRHVDVHDKPAPVVETKKKKKNKNTPVVEMPRPFTFTAGTGILLNDNTEEKKDQLLTNWEHGDIELEMEVMMPKGSNSGIYLQGRYEVQLKDSWGVKNPNYADIGGIHANHALDFAKKMVGVPPATNAAKAPGLWQIIKLQFQAPKFDASGTKIKNAKIVYVDLNGVRIHTNVDLAMATGGPISEKEVAMGPLMIQGNHAQVAIRNIKYKLLKESEVEIRDLTYKVFKGEFQELEDFASRKPSKEGKAKEIDVNLTGEEDNYAIVFSGTLAVPEEDDYEFSFGYTGGIKVVFKGETFIENLSSTEEGVLNRTITIPAGTYPFTIYNYKSAAWRAPRLGFYVKGSKTNRKVFHHYDSSPETPSSTSPIFVDVEGKPKFHRGFVTFGTEGPKLSHTIGVGTQGGVNYFYDLGTANIIGVWRGDFVDATPMWNNRGNGTFEARGAVQWTFLNQSLAELTSKDSTPFPDQTNLDEFKAKGYQLDEASGLPVFKHIYKGVEVTNQIQADPSNTYIVNEVSFSESNLVNWYYKLAEGEVRKMPDGSYAIGGQQYYVNILSGQTPFIREVGGVKELVLLIDASKVKYEIIW
ncbi:MAG: DUF1080 domain-containing protein [Cyclobacteriaceae bacterium]|jgi:hypothetical protein|nr:DUF1080 domain-containing protein [Cyclobacteriaceae bacterium]